VDEEGSPEALEIRRRYIEGEVELVAPVLVIFEVLNALRYKELHTQEELKRISLALEAYAFDLRALMGDYASHAIDLAYENDITLYDASYISLAHLEEAQMYTADRKLINKLHETYRQHVKDINPKT
jgi:predicted nucleic acid-binding protein